MKREIRRVSLLLAIIIFISTIVSTSMAMTIDNYDENINTDEISTIEIEDQEYVLSDESFEEIVEDLNEEETKNEEEVKELEVDEEEIETENEDKYEVDNNVEEVEKIQKRDAIDDIEETNQDSRVIVHEGNLGPDDSFAKWTLDDEGNLYLHKGNMKGYQKREWGFYGETIKSIRLGVDGILYMPEDLNSYFNLNTKNVMSLEFDQVDFSGTKDVQYMFKGLVGLKTLDLSNVDLSAVTNYRSLFDGLKSLEELDISNLDTSNVTNMFGMFSYLESIESIDVSNFDTSNVEDMAMMFYGAKNLKELDISNFDTSKVRDMDYMFCEAYGLGSLTLGEKSILNGRVTLPQVKPSDKYTGGWIKDDGSNRYNTSIEFTRDYDGSSPGRYVREFKSYDVTFKDEDIELDIVSSKGFDRKIALNEVPEVAKPGFVLKEWNTKADGTGDVFNPSTDIVTEDITVYAILEEGSPNVEKVEVTFDSNGGRFIDNKSSKKVEIEKGSVVNRYSENPTRSGYNFLGWKENGKDSLFNFNTVIEEDIVLKASWEVRETVNPPVDPDPIGPTVPDITRPVLPEDQLALVEDKLNLKDHYAYINGYEDNTIRAEKFITREEVAAVFYRLLNNDYRKEIHSNETIFSDVKKSRWSHDEISTLNKGEIVKGYPNGEFMPEKNITRAEISVMASRFDKLKYDGVNRFKDTEKHWAKEYINSAAINGWVIGSEGKFRPNDNMTRAEFVTMINRILNRKTEVENMSENRKVFTDLDSSKWYYKEIEEAANSHEYEIENGVEVWDRVIDNSYEDLFQNK